MAEDWRSCSSRSSSSMVVVPILEHNHGNHPHSSFSSSSSSNSSSSNGRMGRILRESSMLVRETAAEQLEERQTDWAYSRPVVVLDLIWNLAFVMAAAMVLLLSLLEEWEEEEEHQQQQQQQQLQMQRLTPLHAWLLGYALQCLLHMSCVAAEYQRRRRRSWSTAHWSGQRHTGVEELQQSSVAKRLESANTMFSFVWWMVGFYWITAAAGSDSLGSSAAAAAVAQSSPRVYWLCVVFLAFDVFFVVFCIALACVIGIAICCCLPCIIAILYAVADQEGASEDDINLLPVFKFSRTAAGPGTMLAAALLWPKKQQQQQKPKQQQQCRSLSSEDAECCICLTSYDEGSELRELPCNHHFHSCCIAKWLRINATCPLCKFNIIRGGRDVLACQV